MDAITSSKRTLLILSPDFVSGDWPEFEVQCALRESLQKNHRLVPVVLTPLDDVTQDMSPTLQHIVSSFKCVHWPMEDDVTPSNNSENANAFVKHMIRLHQQVAEKSDRVLASARKRVNTVLGREEREATAEDDFWRRLLLTLPQKTQESGKDEDVGLKSVSSQLSSMTSTTSESRDLLPTTTTKTNLITQQHMKDIEQERDATNASKNSTENNKKKVQVVRPWPRQTSVECDDVTETNADVTPSQDAIGSSVKKGYINEIVIDEVARAKREDRVAVEALS